MRTFKIRCSQISKIMGKAKKEGELSATCKTYLHEWYADDHEEIHSKYTEKGKAVEAEAIQFMAEQLGFPFAEKNIDIFSDDYIIGEPDVLPTEDICVDIKCPFNRKTFLDNVSGINEDYVWQGRGYLQITGRKQFILFYALMNTQEDVNYGKAVSYDHLPANQRWLAYTIEHSDEFIEQIYAKVLQCREYLAQYHEQVTKTIGKIN